MRELPMTIETTGKESMIEVQADLESGSGDVDVETGDLVSDVLADAGGTGVSMYGGHAVVAANEDFEAGWTGNGSQARNWVSGYPCVDDSMRLKIN